MNHDEKRLVALNEIAHRAIADAPLPEMLHGIVATLQRGFGWDAVACVTIDKVRGQYECVAIAAERDASLQAGDVRPLDEGGIVQAVASALPVYLLHTVDAVQELSATAPGYRAELCVPVIHDGEVIAAIDIASRLPGSLHDQTVFLEAVAELVAGAIIGARRHEELAQHTELLEVLNRVSRLVLEADNLHESLQQLVDYITEVFPVEICSVLLLNEAGTHFEVEAYSGSMALSTPGDGEWPITVGVCGRAVREGTPQLVTDIHADPDYVSGNKDVRSEYIVPIRFRERILGCLNLESARIDCFTAYNQSVFRTLSDQLAGALNLSTLNRQLEAANRRLSELSFVDHLTGVANRRRFDDELAAEWRRALRHRRHLSVLMADTDCFKLLNDHYGHDVGDECLRIIAATLRDNLREGIDLLCRYGGEEFAILLPETELEGAFAVADKLRRAVLDRAIEHAVSPVTNVASISIGVASLLPEPGMDSRLLLRLADGALYEAKRSGRNCVSRAAEPA